MAWSRMRSSLPFGRYRCRVVDPYRFPRQPHSSQGSRLHSLSTVALGQTSQRCLRCVVLFVSFTSPTSQHHGAESLGRELGHILGRGEPYTQALQDARKCRVGTRTSSSVDGLVVASGKPPIAMTRFAGGGILFGRVLLATTSDSVVVLGAALYASLRGDVQLRRHVEIVSLERLIVSGYYRDMVFVDRLPRCLNSYRLPSSQLES